MSEAASPFPWGQSKTKLFLILFYSTWEQHRDPRHINDLKEAKLAILALVKL